MTEKKDLKSLVRARMAETGERYQAALRQVLAQRQQERSAQGEAPKSDAIDDDAEAYWLVSDSMGELDDRLFRQRGSGVYEDEEVLAMIDEMVAEGLLTPRAANVVKARAAVILADYEWMVT